MGTREGEAPSSQGRPAKAGEVATAAEINRGKGAALTGETVRIEGPETRSRVQIEVARFAESAARDGERAKPVAVPAPEGKRIRAKDRRVQQIRGPVRPSAILRDETLARRGRVSLTMIDVLEWV